MSTAAQEHTPSASESVEAARNRLSEFAARIKRLRGAALLAAGLPLVLMVVGVWVAVSGRAALLALWPAMGALALLAPRLSPRGAGDLNHIADALDTRFASLQDSTRLLTDGVGDHGVFARWQQARVADELLALHDDGRLAEALPRFGWRLVTMSWLAAAIVAVSLAALGPGQTREPRSILDAGVPVVAPASVLSASIQVAPPDYVGLPARRSATLSVDTVAFARLRWQLIVDSEASDVRLAFHDGTSLALTARGNRRWQSSEWVARDAVYDIIIDGRPQPQVHRISVRPDRSPVVQLDAPVNPLVIESDAPKAPRIDVAIAARDDYGLGAVDALVTLASGNGEQVRFRERRITLVSGQGRTALELEHPFDLDALGMTAGDELYLVIEASDNAPDGGQTGQSATLIVRWPAESARTSVVLATTAVPVLPAYFRSQRQIILDTEALLAERASLEPSEVSHRAQVLAGDQKALRLRYGQYLGEEAESGIGEGLVPENIAAADDDHDDHDDHGTGDEEQTDRSTLSLSTDGHDHAGHGPEGGSFGASSDPGGAAQAMAPFMHFHDRAEQSTLFDPATTRTLKRALAAMWDAELALRLGDPAGALPFEYDALAAIKEVQQSDRIYLRRSGFRPTPIDEGRRFSGEIDDVDTQSDIAQPGGGDNTTLRMLVDAATGVPADGDLSILLNTAAAEVQALARQQPDALALLAALESWRRDPSCGDCRRAFVARAWSQLSAQPPGPTRAGQGDSRLREAYTRRLTSPGSAQ